MGAFMKCLLRVYSGIMYFGVCASNYALSYYLPTVLTELGYSSSEAQVQTIPIYAAAFVVALATAWTSDRLHHRFSFVMIGVSINILGYIVLLVQAAASVKVRYMALYFVLCGLWIASPVVIVWASNNLGGHYKRAIGVAIVNGMGNMAGFVAGNVFIASQSPRYPVGYGAILAMSVLAGVAATMFYLGLRRENRKRDRGERDELFEMNKEELDNAGDDDPRFRFAL